MANLYFAAVFIFTPPISICIAFQIAEHTNETFVTLALEAWCLIPIKMNAKI